MDMRTQQNEFAEIMSSRPRSVGVAGLTFDDAVD
jgi:hypothetical protein